MPAPAHVDVLDTDWDPSAWWTTTNFGEAVPGVLTALNWSFWSEHGERAIRRVFHTLGVLPAEGLEVPADPAQRVLGVFSGRIAGKVDFLGWVGDRLPGTSGAKVAESLIGELPPGFVSAPTRERWPAVLRRMPPTFVSLPRRLRAIDAQTAAWWRTEVSQRPRTLDEAKAQFRDARAWFERALYHQILSIFAGVQPVYDRVQALATRSGDPGLAPRLLAGQGAHAELAMVEGLWSISRGRAGVEAFLMEHGFHGPLEGEISSRVWREDPAPVHTLVDHYRRLGEDESPQAVHREGAEERRRAKDDLLQRLGPRGRPGAELTLRLAEIYIPIRGLGKAAFLRSLDVARAASRRAGELLAEGGALADPDGVYHLTATELLDATPQRSLRDVVDVRARQRAEHATRSLPAAWKGRPQLITTAPAPVAGDAWVLSGLGVSPGVVEAPVRVLLAPEYLEVEEGEILVARFTDPSWASIMLCSSALVVEVGGALSHAAVIARELGVPCVMGVEGATSRLRTGDVCRVDGRAGTVEILRSAG